jgi:uncharacterized protein
VSDPPSAAVAPGGGHRTWRVHVAELRRRTGEQRRVTSTGPLDDAAVGSSRLDPAEVAVELVLEAVSGGVAVRGSARATWTGQCRRCLDPVQGPLVVEVDEVFEDRPTEGETYPVEGDALDLGPMLREVVLLALPLGPLCREDCAGPDPDHFPVTVGTDETGPDPRWSALDALREN